MIYRGGESDWGEDVRSWKKVYGEERAKRGELLGMVVEGALREGVIGDGSSYGGWGRFSRGLWADGVARRGFCSFVFVFVFRHVKRRIDGTAEAN